MAFNFAPRELEREAGIWLRKLTANGSYLRAEAGRKWGLMSPRNKFTKPVAMCDDKLVQAMEQHGWVKFNPLGHVELNSGGITWLAAKGKLPANLRTDKKRKQTNKGSATERSGIKRSITENPLAWLAGRKNEAGQPLLSDQMFEAGERLRRDFEIGQMGQRVTAQWGAAITPGARGRSGGTTGGLSANERALSARQRVWQALEHVGPGLSSILLEVCCLASGLEAAERHLKWPKRSAKLVLIIALQRLADHYGYTPHTAARQRKSLQMWGAVDYRPELLGHLQDAAEGSGVESGTGV